MKHFSLFLIALFVLSSCSSDSSEDEVTDEGIFLLRFSQDGDFASYRTSVTVALGASTLTNCDGETSPNLILYNLSEIASCSIETNTSSSQFVGAIDLSGLKSTIVEADVSKFSAEILFEGKVVWEREVDRNMEEESTQLSFVLYPEDL